ncbi:MAG TPA: sulfite exporter TauE/SafE family protein, partial [Mycobacteriales bacterium]|nr:sulfite exporter TauE/SafE family protein [Mycobacteriales bacterium]
MLSSITPLGERGRGRRWITTATAYLLGSVVGGSLLGLALGALGSMLDVRTSLALAVIAAVALVGVLLDTKAGRVALPTVHRQVNETWLSEYRGVIVGWGWGFQLGLGVVTIVTTSLVYLTWVAALLTGSLAGGLLVGLVFGLVRGLPIVAMRNVNEPVRLAAVHR